VNELHENGATRVIKARARPSARGRETCETCHNRGGRITVTFPELRLILGSELPRPGARVRIAPFRVGGPVLRAPVPAPAEIFAGGTSSGPASVRGPTGRGQSAPTRRGERRARGPRKLDAARGPPD